ncbi:hypothetical protein HQQ81_08820 [Microbacteriaceae bacterium VKM Ac-2854]|nr:hypothetical protein [Microbacteriaceae bacterium VKM Ac-2854]
MSWWSWILIWLGLALLLLGVLAFFGLRLFRKGMALLRQTEELTAKMARLTDYAEAESVRRNPSAILVPYEQVYRRREERRELREERILDRRAARVRRGKLLVHRNPIVK